MTHPDARCWDCRRVPQQGKVRENRNCPIFLPAPPRIEIPAGQKGSRLKLAACGTHFRGINRVGRAEDCLLGSRFEGKPVAFAGERFPRAIRRSRRLPVVSYENVGFTFFSRRANAATEFTVPLWGGFASEVTLGFCWRTIVPLVRRDLGGGSFRRKRLTIPSIGCVGAGRTVSTETSLFVRSSGVTGNFEVANCRSGFGVGAGREN